eukprot:5618488-Lingulodinium_polyedra.AAC.1
MRDVFTEPPLIHAWADSSPQGGRHWLLSRTHYVVDRRFAVAADAFAFRPAVCDQVVDAPA